MVGVKMKEVIDHAGEVGVVGVLDGLVIGDCGISVFGFREANWEWVRRLELVLLLDEI